MVIVNAICSLYIKSQQTNSLNVYTYISAKAKRPLVVQVPDFNVSILNGLPLKCIKQTYSHIRPLGAAGALAVDICICFHDIESYIFAKLFPSLAV